MASTPRRPKCGHPVSAARSCSPATSVWTAALIFGLWTRLMIMEYWWNVKNWRLGEQPFQVHFIHYTGIPWDWHRASAPGSRWLTASLLRQVQAWFICTRNAHCTPISSQLTVVEKPPFQILQNTFLRNKLHLFSLTQHRFDSNCAFTCALHASACQNKNLTKEDIIRI